MRTALVIGIVAAMLASVSATHTQTATPASEASLKVILLGTAAGPTINPERLGISTLVVAGSESLLLMQAGV